MESDTEWSDFSDVNYIDWNDLDTADWVPQKEEERERKDDEPCSRGRKEKKSIDNDGFPKGTNEKMENVNNRVFPEAEYNTYNDIATDEEAEYQSDSSDWSSDDSRWDENLNTYKTTLRRERVSKLLNNPIWDGHGDIDINAVNRAIPTYYIGRRRCIDVIGLIRFTRGGQSK